MSIDLAQAKALLTRRESEKKDDKPTSDSDILWYNIPQDGECKFRVAPPWEGSGLPGKLIYKHYNIPEKEGCTCLKTWDMECPVCAVLEKYVNEPQLIEPFKYAVRSAVNVEVISDPRNTNSNIVYPPNKWHILMSGDYTLIWLIEKILDPDAGDVTDPFEGHDVIFKRKSKGGQIDRSISLRPRPLAPTEAEINEKLTKIYNLDKIWKSADDNYIKYVTDCATLVENSIKLQVSSDNNLPPAVPTMSDTPKTSSIVSNKPSNLPSCWGEHDEANEKCMICSQEVQCMEVSKSKPF